MNAEFRIVNGANAGQVVPLAGKQLLIGRERDCHLRLASELVSRHHCVIRQDEFTLRVRDLGSKNGTYVNGHRILGEVVLVHGDMLFVGELTMQVCVQSAEAATATRDPAAHDTQRNALQETTANEAKTTLAPKTNYPPASSEPPSGESGLDVPTPVDLGVAKKHAIPKDAADERRETRQ